MIMTTAAAAAAVTASMSTGCDQSDSNTGSLPTSVSNTPSGRPATTRRTLPTTDEIFGRMPSTNASPTSRSARTPTTGDSNDPLATPQSAVTHLIGLMEKEDVLGVRSMMADPSLPLNQLGTEVSAVANRLHGGAKWELVQTHTDGVASVVIFRTTFPDGRSEFAPLVLVNRYDRWKVLLGPLNLRKFADFEKADMKQVLAWAASRLNELQGVPTIRPTTATTPTTTG
jgi:hypothetical protein